MSEIGQKRNCPCFLGKSVLPSGADVVRPPGHVRKVPGRDSCTATIGHLLGTFRNIKRDQHALLAWSSGRRPLVSEGDHLLKHHHPAVANSFAICAKPGWSACRYRSIIALFSGLASCSARAQAGEGLATSEIRAARHLINKTRYKA